MVAGPVRRGVASSGGEFAPSTLPGTYGTDYHYDGAASLTYLAGRGHKLVRFAFQWERIQRTLGGALDTTEAGRLDTFITNAAAAGLSVILDVHNYGNYNSGSGPVPIGAPGGPTQAQFVDLWTRLSTRYKANAAVVGYGLMNEPNGLPAPPLDAANRVSTTYSSWVADDSGATVTGTTFGTDNVVKMVRANTNTFMNATSPFLAVTVGERLTVSADFYCNYGTNDRIRLRMEFWTAAGGSVVAGGDIYSNQPTAPASTWTNLQYVVTVPAGATVAKMTVYTDDTTAVGQFAYVRNAYVAVLRTTWQRASQAAVTAIRANTDTKTILVPGDSWSGVADWAANNPTAWITDSASNFLYEGHHYWDHDHSGSYAATYATEVASAVTDGWSAGGYLDALTNRTMTELANWQSWLAANGVQGFVGEMGWPRNIGGHTGDYASWAALGSTWYGAADAYQMWVTAWSTSEWWGTYPLSVYDVSGGVLATTTSISPVVEAHPQFTPATTYTVTTPFSVFVDWNRNGSFADTGDDVTDRVRGGLSCSYGRDQASALSPVVAGRGAFTLDNTSRDYSPRNGASPLTGNVKPSRPVLVQRVVSSTTYTLFRGHTDDSPIDPDVDSKTVGFTLIDTLGDFRGVKVTTPLYQGIRTGTAIGIVLTAAGWTGTQTLDAGSTTIPWFWADGADAYDLLQQLLVSEGPPALLTIDPSGAVVFRDRQHRLTSTASTTSQATFSGSGSTEPLLAPGFRYSEPWSNIINDVSISVSERAASSQLVQVWTSDDTIGIPASSSYVVVISTSDPFYGAVTPVSGVDFQLSGSITSVTLSRTSGASTSVTLTAGAGGAQVTGLQLRAFSLPVARTRVVTASDATSQTAYGVRTLPSGSEPVWASYPDVVALAALHVARSKNPLTQITARFVCGDSQTARLAAVLARNLSDRVTVVEAETVTNGPFYIESITHEVTSVVEHVVTFGLEAVPSSPSGAFILGSSTLNGADPLAY